MTGSSSIMDMKASLVSSLTRELSGVQVLDGYRNAQYFGELEKPLMNVTIKEVQSVPQGFGDHLGFELNGGQTNQVRGTLGKVVFSLALQLPAHTGGQGADEYLLKIFDALQKDPNTAFLSMQCGEMSFREEIQAFFLEITVQAELILFREEELAAIERIELRADCAE